MNIRSIFFLIVVLVFVASVLMAWLWPIGLLSLIVLGPIVLIGLWDSFQTKHTIRRNFPVLGHGRYLMEMIRPEIQQYFIESSLEAYPIEREFRSVVYQRSKGDLETVPFGSHRNMNASGHEWAEHSISPAPVLESAPRITVGAEQCAKPYNASILNISAMSYGALSSNAIRALNRGAAKGGFAHNTGEGGISPHHLEHGGDLIWQVGTGYFGCRTSDGGFDPKMFAQRASHDSVKMIELKLSQGAKPGHGGVLPACKVDHEIAEIRGVEPHKTVLSPPGHSVFSNPTQLVEFLAQLRELSGGKPVGFKICIGKQSEFYAICKAMVSTGLRPDFITVDGAEGGTGAAPLEFANSIGMPAHDAWIFVHNALVGVGLRDSVKVFASGKIMTGFHILRAIALGADACNSARGMMLSLGCIQALRCNTNHCPTGVATNNPSLAKGLKVTDKSERVAKFHDRTIKGFLELLGALGLNHPNELRPHHINRRTGDTKIRNYADLYEWTGERTLLTVNGESPEGPGAWNQASPERWST